EGLGMRHVGGAVRVDLMPHHDAERSRVPPHRREVRVVAHSLEEAHGGLTHPHARCHCRLREAQLAAPLHERVQEMLVLLCECFGEGCLGRRQKGIDLVVVHVSHLQVQGQRYRCDGGGDTSPSGEAGHGRPHRVARPCASRLLARSICWFCRSAVSASLTPMTFWCTWSATTWRGSSSSSAV